MIELSPEWQMIINEINKHYKKYAKAIKKVFRGIRNDLNAFINRLKAPYKYRYFTINECKKIKPKKHKYQAKLLKISNY
ncbi:hypothetical protein AVBRAN12640_06205 [Campylobacter sp. RM12640]|uniref:hypothetical protein n=1 Tax=unclassified Campylobacter TaxID=2593542 RepID=UPI001D6D6F9D|nr:hypothetical protein [Campylobacter sp. RM12640]MBZ7989701.1 hypothetical protein [Campylobacter sp. RM12635]MBZ7991759.1 hypothetical protein [Campylobacter sp. RM9331]MBZ8005187.1 hypothetical protein [Campylobacter sp. RM9332]